MTLYTFGCSLTRYHYPTWADIIGREFPAHQNWGRPGAGNNYILSALTRCHLENHITPQDRVIIAWTGLARIDYYQINDWSHIINQYYDLDQRGMPYCCPDGYQWLSFSWITAAQHMLDHIGVPYQMFYWQPMDQNTEPYRIYRATIDRLVYAPLMANTRDYRLHPRAVRTAQLVYDRCRGKDWPKLESILDRSYLKLPLTAEIKTELDDFCQLLQQDTTLNSAVYKEIDGHPSPLQHLAWAQQWIPDVTVSQATQEWVHDIDQAVFEQRDYDFKTV